LLFAPAVRPDLITKMPATGADAIVIDLEDATPPNAKAQGRNNLQAAMRELADSIPVLARINDPTTPWYRDDINALPPGLAGIVVPKIETVEGLDQLSHDLGLFEGFIVGGIETALGVADSRALLAHRAIDAAYFGAEDFMADMGGVRTEANHEVAYARSQVALAARLGSIVVVDQIVADFRDDARFERECVEAKAIGYRGKLCIHPSQVAIANRCFLPTPDEVDRAERLVAAYVEAQAAGVASIAFEGQMVDEPVAAQARRVIELASD